MLLIDSGNSRIKWAFVQDGSWKFEGSVSAGNLDALPQSFANLPRPHNILVSNVAGSDVAEKIRKACAPWHIPAEFLTAQQSQCGVRNSYIHPDRLGSDRWAALIAAWQRVGGACLVVTSGTATTIDALSHDGTFLGGLILPGLEMMRHCLAEGTSQLSSASGSLLPFPIDTADAIFSGSIQATVGAIQRQHSLLIGDSVPCVLSGGAADALAKGLMMPLICIDNLVLHGLQQIGMDSPA